MKTIVTKNCQFIIEKINEDTYKIEVYERFEKYWKGIRYLDTIYTNEEIAKEYGY